ncbi:GAF domain-containing protein [Marivirga sp.]|uniref:GAF domain-containing protein n=1 Tax=Marivirga sp. TaxID=2018662 RepID=UPI002D7EF649|nr:GAF domain-containing protein [Marivirga sp.]HET8859710.1 GAF domain-containing protein [Marivirga sp.]
MKIRDLAIRKKFILSFSLLLFMMLVGGLVVGYLWSQVDEYQQVKSDVAETMMRFDNAQKIEQDFLIFGWKEIDFLEDGQSKFTEQFFNEVEKVEESLAQKTKSEFVNKKELASDFSSILISINSYKKSFDELRKLLYTRGFKDHGLEGEMRTYAHDLQKRESAEEKVFAFSLRRHEKDFALRKDLSYTDKLHNTADEFIEFVKYADIQEYPHMTAAYKTKTIEDIKAYKNHFDKIVQTEIVIGLNEKSGQFLQLNRNKKETEPRISALYEKINEQNESLRQTASFVIGFTLLILLLTVFALVYYLRKTVSKPIIKLDNIVKKVLSGDSHASKDLHHEGKDEIGSLYRNFSLMLDNLKENLKLIKDKNESLQQKAKQDEIRSWNIEGLSHFSDLMKGNNTNLGEFANSIISETVKYINANQGAFFILNDENKEPVMELKACYAFNKKKYIHKIIEKGEGLVGQTWLEGEAIYMTEVPSSYINITSGLGDAPPRSIMILPLKTEQQTVGVLEIASFQEFEKHEQDLLTELANRLGSVIESIKMQEKTQKLLEQSQEMTEQMQAQEEEMRQNMEELQATQEEMERNQKSLNKAINFKDLQINMMNSLLGKVYEGVIFINKDYQIVASNNYITDDLHYNEGDLMGNNPELIFKTSLKKKIEALQNDPNFILTGVSERQEAKIMDKFNNIFDSRFVITKIEQKGEVFHAVLFNKKDAEFGKRVLKHLFQAK